MIGNDIIDLDLTKTESNWQREGFLKKQFTKSEQLLIKKSKDSFETVWLLWSMKEAAYKIWVQQNKERIFAPIKFECELSKQDEGTVKHKDYIYYTDSMINESFIHTIALLEKKAEVYSQIGSPHGIDATIKKNIKAFKTAFQKYDLYVLFYEKGLELLKKQGILSYITSNKFLSQGYGLKLRQLFLNYSINNASLKTNLTH